MMMMMMMMMITIIIIEIRIRDNVRTFVRNLCYKKCQQELIASREFYCILLFFVTIFFL